MYKEGIIKRTYALCSETIHFLNAISKTKYSTDVISKQLIRSITSICANIVEAQGGSSRKDFINFYHHALKSSNESRFWLALLRDTEKIDKEKINTLLQETKEVSNILGACIVSLKNKKK